MNVWSYVILFVIILVMALVIYFKIKRIKDGKGFCSCGCDGCTNAECKMRNAEFNDESAE